MIRTITARLLCVFSLCTASVAHADLEFKFIEGAPKDRFVISNASECTIKKLLIDIDLSTSAGKLIFDTTADGAGVEVYQPFASDSSAIVLVSSSAVKDGDTLVSLRVEAIEPNESASFTIDVDDTMTESELGNIRVADSEIEGGSVSIRFDPRETFTAYFNDSSKAVIATPPCP